jgi:hypothetical protein
MKKWDPLLEEEESISLRGMRNFKLNNEEQGIGKEKLKKRIYDTRLSFLEFLDSIVISKIKSNKL